MCMFPKSGVMDMKPCKRDSMAPVALSQPHFYNADQGPDSIGGKNLTEKSCPKFFRT